MRIIKVGKESIFYYEGVLHLVIYLLIYLLVRLNNLIY